jgi:hypothetical protein
MEISQWNSFIAILNKNVIFSFYKIREQDGRTDSAWGVGVGAATNGKEEDVGKGCGRVNIVQILYTHV